MSAPQQFCDDCHGVGKLGKRFDPAWQNDLAGYRTRTREVGFFGVPEARRVEQLILDTFKEKAA